MLNVTSKRNEGRKLPVINEIFYGFVLDFTLFSYVI